MQKLKALGLAFVAVFAMSAVVASAAQGHAAFTSEKAGATLTGAQLESAKHVFTTTHGTVNCSVATFHGTAGGTEETTQKLAPTYSSCLFAGLSTEVNMTGCEYEFIAGETIAGSSDTITSSVKVVCPEGKKIDVNPAGSICEITVGPQTIANGITLHNSGGGSDILAKVDVTNSIKYTIHNPTSCPNKSDITERENGSYTGEATLTAHKDGSAVKISVH